MTCATLCPCAWGQWPVQLLQCTAPLPWGLWALEVVQCTPEWAKGTAQLKSCNALPNSVAQRVVHFLHCIAPLLGSSAKCSCCHALPARQGAVGTETSAMHCLTGWD